MRNRMLLLSSVGIILLAGDVNAQCISDRNSSYSYGHNWAVTGVAWSPGMMDVLRTSASEWNLAEQAANSDPTNIFSEVSPAQRNLTITLDYGLSGTTTWAEATDLEIRVNPDTFGWGQAFTQGVLTHELGHTIGYQHVPANCNSVMREFMSPSSFTQWMSTSDYTAVWYDYHPTYCGDPDTCSPLLLDLGAHGVDLTGPSMLFDITATGHPSSVGWTPFGTEDGFLCLDRNSDGIIRDGAELFGDATPLSWTTEGVRAANGFSALAFFDDGQQGGNSDGQLDPRDRVFPFLCVWTDKDRNGVSTPNELRSLAEYGIRAIELTYKSSMRKDEHGNLFRYRSRFLVEFDGSQGTETRGVWDVFLAGTTK